VVLKFYLHDAATSDTGTLPGAAASVSTITPDVIGSGVNRSMDATIGVLQTSRLINTIARTTPTQGGLIARFLSAPIAAQTFADQAIDVRLGASEASTNSNFLPTYCLVVWRPGTGAVVGRIRDNPSTGGVGTEPGTTETNTLVQVFTSTPVTSQDGDVLVLELWRFPGTQAMATTYANTAFYDGTVEGSTTTNAAYLLFTNDVSMSAGGPAANPVHRNPMVQLLSH
jgi:hypothetical protein